MRKVTIDITTRITVSVNDDTEISDVIDNFDVILDTDEADIVDVSVESYEVVDSR